MSEFVFLYRGGDRPTSPEQGQKVMESWMAWFKDMTAKGHVVDRGQPLERSGKIVQGSNRTVTDGPFAEAKDVVGGYTLIQAADLEAAAVVAKGCPICDSGGYVEIRPVMHMEMQWTRSIICSGASPDA